MTVKVRNLQSLPALRYLVSCNVIMYMSGPSLLVESTDVARQTTQQVSPDFKRTLVTTVAIKGILRLLIGANTNHNVKKDSFKDTGRLPSGLIIMIVERTQ